MTKCIMKNCEKLAYYNYIYTKPVLYCNEHKCKDMINISRNICIEKNCNKYAYYNIESIKKKQYCKLHKTNDMISYTDYSKKRKREVDEYNINVKDENVINVKDKNVINVKDEYLFEFDLSLFDFYNNEDNYIYFP